MEKVKSANSRINTKVRLMNEVYVESGDSPPAFFGAHKPVRCLVPRSVENYNSMGTWLTSSSDHARKYGPFIYKFEIPEGRYLVAHTDHFGEFFLNWPLAREWLTDKEMAHLTKYPERRTLPREYPERGYQERTRRIIDKLLLDRDYIRAFRDNIERAGYAGVVWLESRIDLKPRDEPHDVFLVFLQGELCPVAGPNEWKQW